jgi:hypothetical protein
MNVILKIFIEIFVKKLRNEKWMVLLLSIMMVFAIATGCSSDNNNDAEDNANLEAPTLGEANDETSEDLEETDEEANEEEGEEAGEDSEEETETETEKEAAE